MRVPSTVALPGDSSLSHRYSEVKPLLKELDRLIEAALERILQPTPGNGSEDVSPPLDLELWNQIPLVLIDEHDKDNPVILDIFETNQTADGNKTATDNETSVSSDPARGYQSSGDNETTSNGTTVENQSTAPPPPANTTSEEKKYKLAVKLVRGVPQWQQAGMRDGCLGKGTSVSPPHLCLDLGLCSGCASSGDCPCPAPAAEPRAEPGQGCSMQVPRPLHPFLGSKCQGEAVAAAPSPFLLQSAVQRHKVVLQPLTSAPREASRTLPEQTSEAGETPALKNWPRIDISC